MRIGIIGSGGSGMSAAWLLDKNHDVTLFEKRNYLGGHTHSVEVILNGKNHIIDDGAAWFSPSIYPYFNAYLDIVGVEFDWIPLSLTYYNQSKQQVNCMPPVTARNILAMFTSRTTLPELLALNKAVNAAKTIVANKQTSVDFKTFIDGLSVSEKIKENFLKPLLSGLWGAPYDETNTFSIYPLMKYIVYHKPSGLQYYNWKTMKGGTKNYIATVHKNLKKTTTILNAEVQKIEFNKENNTVQVFTKDNTYSFDKLIITGGARDSAMLLKNSIDYNQAFEILNQFKCYKATLATHSDVSLMPPDRKDWSVVNVTFNGVDSYATIWHGSKNNEDIFCSYINPDNGLPKNLHHTSEWWLPCETPEFYQLQNQLATVQGINNVYLGGDYTHDIGSHEDAILSSVNAVEKIAPDSERLIELKKAAALYKG